MPTAPSETTGPARGSLRVDGRTRQPHGPTGGPLEPVETVAAALGCGAVETGRGPGGGREPSPPAASGLSGLSETYPGPFAGSYEGVSRGGVRQSTEKPPGKGSFFGQLRPNGEGAQTVSSSGARFEPRPAPAHPDPDLSRPKSAELRRAEAEPWNLAAADGIRFLCGRAAMSGYRTDSDVVPRSRVLRWMGHDIRTRTGKSRRDRIATCGMVFAARQGDALGLAHRWCRDRMCPGCMKRRQSQRSRFLHAYVDNKHAQGVDLLFVTFTQVKQDIAHETAAQALSRLHTSRREVFNPNDKGARTLRAMVPGGVFFTELAWSYKGKERRDGSRVTYSGWHAHAHGIVEVAAAPSGVSRKAWRNMVRRRLVAAWLGANPEASASAQKVVTLRPEQAGQVCKYPLKPFDHRNPKRQREACLALAGRRTNDAYGGWRSWTADGKALADSQRDPRKATPPIELGDVSLSYIQRRAEWGARIYFDKPGQGREGRDTTGVAAVDLLRSVVADPRTFQRRALEARPEKRPSVSRAIASGASPQGPPSALRESVRAPP